MAQGERACSDHGHRHLAVSIQLPPSLVQHTFTPCHSGVIGLCATTKSACKLALSNGHDRATTLRYGQHRLTDRIQLLRRKPQRQLRTSSRGSCSAPVEIGVAATSEQSLLPINFHSTTQRGVVGGDFGHGEMQGTSTFLRRGHNELPVRGNLRNSESQNCVTQPVSYVCWRDARDLLVTLALRHKRDAVYIAFRGKNEGYAGLQLGEGTLERVANYFHGIQDHLVVCADFFGSRFDKIASHV